MKNIIVAVDFTDLTDATISRARDFARVYSSKVWLVHVAAPDPDFVGYEVGPQYIRDNRAKTLREEHKALQAYAEDLKKEGFSSEALLIQGPTVETLLQKAQDLKAELLVMGAHNHGLLFEKLIGSTWSDVIRKSRIPLLIVPEFAN